MKIICVLFSFCRFSSGDLTAESDDVESQQGEGDSSASGKSIPPPLQQQPMPGGPPNIPPPLGLLPFSKASKLTFK